MILYLFPVDGDTWSNNYHVRAECEHLLKGSFLTIEVLL